MRHNPDRGIMTDFVQCRAVPIYLVEIGVPWRNLDEIQRRHVESLVATNAQIGPGRTQEAFRTRHRHMIGLRYRGHRHLGGQVVALLHVEHREPFQERHGPRIGLLLVPIRNERARKEDGRPLFTPADISARGESLTECQPTLARETRLLLAAPKQENIDPGITTPCRRITRH